MTTFCTVCADRRICETVPLNGRSGKASTEKVASCPVFTRPMSDSSMFVRTCIFVRSCAMVKSVGAWNDAATVWPTSYWRATTTPSIGEAIFVYWRFVCACLIAASACLTDAAAPSRLASAVSRSDLATSCCAKRFLLRV